MDVNSQDGGSGRPDGGGSQLSSAPLTGMPPMPITGRPAARSLVSGVCLENVECVVYRIKESQRTCSLKQGVWTVEEARQFLVSARKDNDPLNAPWVLILVMALRRGEAMGVLDDDSVIDEAAEEISRMQLVKPPGYPLRHKQELKTDGSPRRCRFRRLCLRR
jgi:hypothetical protein